MAYRYAALQAHYRKPMEYSDEAIENAGEDWSICIIRLGNFHF